jgi:hypothetical protein
MKRALRLMSVVVIAIVLTVGCSNNENEGNEEVVLNEDELNEEVEVIADEPEEPAKIVYSEIPLEEFSDEPREYVWVDFDDVEHVDEVPSERQTEKDRRAAMELGGLPDYNPNKLHFSLNRETNELMSVIVIGEEDFWTYLILEETEIDYIDYTEDILQGLTEEVYRDLSKDTGTRSALDSRYEATDIRLVLTKEAEDYTTLMTPGVPLNIYYSENVPMIADDVPLMHEWWQLPFSAFNVINVEILEDKIILDLTFVHNN